jgi:hypothetical protein
VPVAPAAQPELGSAAVAMVAGGDELDGKDVEDVEEGAEDEEVEEEDPGALDPAQEETSSPRAAADTSTSTPRGLDRPLTGLTVVRPTWLLRRSRISDSVTALGFRNLICPGFGRDRFLSPAAATHPIRSDPIHPMPPRPSDDAG